MTQSNIKKRVAILPWPEKENCFLCISGKGKRQELYGSKWYVNNHDERKQEWSSEFKTEPAITFAYRGKNVAAEWDGNYGPIQLWFKCEKDYSEKYDTARQHWLYEYAYGHGHWSQIAVDDNNLYEAFNHGDYDHIFSVLKSFVDDREKCDEE